MRAKSKQPLRTHRGRFVLAGLAIICLFATVESTTQAKAADVVSPVEKSARPSVPTWTFSNSAYLWATGLKGDLRTLPPLPTARVNLSFGDVLKNLNGALMTTVEARKDRLILFSDLILTHVSSGRDFSVAGVAGTVNLKSFSFTGIGAVGYRVVDDPKYSVDVLGGGRLWIVKNTLGLSAAGVRTEFGKTETWVDGIVGARIKLNVTDKFYFSTIGFVGGISSKYMWDVYSGVGYVFNDRWNAFAGYRALRVDYRNGNFIYRVTQHGPVIGATYKF
jgi:hypothetical protein